MKYVFWGCIGNPNGVKHCEIVEIPDDQLAGKSDDEKEMVLLKAHIDWIERHSFGDWEPFEEVESHE